MDNIKQTLGSRKGNDLLMSLCALRDDLSVEVRHSFSVHQGPWLINNDTRKMVNSLTNRIEEYQALCNAEVRLVNDSKTNLHKVFSKVLDAMNNDSESRDDYYDLLTQLKIWVYDSLMGNSNDSLELVRRIQKLSNVISIEELKTIKFNTHPIRINVIDLTTRDNSSYIRGLAKAGFVEFNLVHTKEGSDYKYMKKVASKYSYLRLRHVPVQPMYEDMALEWDDNWIDEKVALATKTTVVIADKQEDINPYLKYITNKSFCIKLPQGTKTNNKEIQEMTIKIL